MNESETAGRQPGGGNGVDAASISRHPHSTTTGGRRQGPLHGKIVAGVWRKQVRASRHMLRRPRLAWAVDADDLTAALAAGARILRLVDSESGATFEVMLRRLATLGVEFDRGYGRQIALGVEHFAKREPVRPGEPEQLRMEFAA